MKTIVGIRPTGEMHIGHYASVIKPALETAADVLIASYHADVEDIEEQTRVTREYLRNFGLTNIKDHQINIDLYFQLLKAAPAHLLNAMPQYKAKGTTAHMYIYPVLMAHDLVGYDRVIVGEDQRPHVEFANDLFDRVGLPRIVGIYDSGKIMSLRSPEKKMSSSEPDTCLFLYDSEADKKIRKAVTTPEGRANLEYIYMVLGGKHCPDNNQELKAAIYKRYCSL